MFNNNSPQVCLGYRLLDTKDKPDQYEDSAQRVDASLFNVETIKEAQDEYKDAKSSKKASSSPQWDLHKLHIEFKRSKKFDAFNDDTADFEGHSDVSERTRAQIISYAALVFRYQQRKFLFTVLIAGQYARFIRWDRAGAIVTNRFDYTMDPQPLCKFLQRFSRLSSAQQGLDESVTLATPEERAVMRRAAEEELTHRDYARKTFEKSLQAARAWWKVRVPTPDNPERHFFVGTPKYCTRGLPGRGTRGYVALDPHPANPKKRSSKFVWLKDVWRIDDHWIKQEGLILKELNDKGKELNDNRFKHLPTLLCHGDVPEPSSDSGANSDNSAVHVQRTETGDYRKCTNQRANPFKTHIHYRMVVQEVGQSLRYIQNGLQLAIVICDCLQGGFLIFR